MSETAAPGALPNPAPEGSGGTDARERAALVAFVVVATVATVSWLLLLGWLLVRGVRAISG